MFLSGFKIASLWDRQKYNKGYLKTFSWYCHISWDLFNTSAFISLFSR